MVGLRKKVKQMQSLNKGEEEISPSRPTSEMNEEEMDKEAAKIANRIKEGGVSERVTNKENVFPESNALLDEAKREYEETKTLLAEKLSKGDFDDTDKLSAKIRELEKQIYNLEKKSDDSN